MRRANWATQQYSTLGWDCECCRSRMPECLVDRCRRRPSRAEATQLKRCRATTLQRDATRRADALGALMERSAQRSPVLSRPIRHTQSSLRIVSCRLLSSRLVAYILSCAVLQNRSYKIGATKYGRSDRALLLQVMIGTMQCASPLVASSRV